MLALTDPIKTRLAALPALDGWAVRTGTELFDRRTAPVADVRCSGAVVADSRTSAVMVAPEWAIALVVKRGDAAAGQIDVAFAAVVDSQSNWKPGQHGGRGWEPLKLARVTEPLFDDAGLVGCELVFSTCARYMGQN